MERGGRTEVSQGDLRKLDVFNRTIQRAARACLGALDADRRNSRIWGGSDEGYWQK